MVFLLAICSLPAPLLFAEPAMGPDGGCCPPPVSGLQQLKDCLGLSEEQTAKMEAILTDAQKEKWKQMGEDRKGGFADHGFGRKPFPGDMPPRSHGMGPGGPGEEHGAFDKGPPGIMDALQLSEQQKGKVQEIFEANKAKFEALRDEEDAKVQEIRTEIDSQIRPLLSKEQQTVFDDLAKLRAAQDAIRKDSAALRKNN